MRVLVDGRPLRDPLSGVGQYVRNLLGGAASILGPDSRLDIEVQTFSFLGRNLVLRQQPIDRRIPEHRRTLLHRKAFNGTAAYLPWVPASVLGVHPHDVGHVTYFERFPYPYSGAARVATIYDVAFLRHPQLFTKANLAGSRRALDEQVRNSDAIITISEFTKAELLHYFGAEFESKIFVTPLAVTDPCGAEPPPPPPISRPYFLYLGNIEPRKGLIDLLEAWKRSKLGEDFALVLAGAAAYLSRYILSEITAASVHQVRYLGYVTPAVKASLLHHAHTFVYPSLYEGFGIPVLEALSVGTPVITTDVSALPELVGTAASLINPGDIEQLASEMRLLAYNDERRSSLRISGPLRAAEYSWQRTASLTIDVYRNAQERQ